jgi:hypothetical protein
MGWIYTVEPSSTSRLSYDGEGAFVPLFSNCPGCVTPELNFYTSFGGMEI